VCVCKLCVSRPYVSKLCVCVQVVCVSRLYVSKLCVCRLYVSKLCVCKLCVSKLCVGGGGGREADGKAAADGRRTGCRTKNKNPTQRCGEKCSKLYFQVSAGDVTYPN